MPSPIGYIAYIDEAGDDGLQRVRPADPGAASEWMALSCVLIRSDREREVLPWLKALIGAFGQHQMTHLHFRQLRDDQKRQAAEYLANLPIRLFTIISNKQNMRGYSNPVAAQAKINVTGWFYVWLARILVERVTDYCSRKTLSHHGEVRSIRFEFASRGGVNVGDVARYLRYLHDQDNLGLMYNTYWRPSWDVMNFDEIHTYPAKSRAGMQLADCVASAFYSAVEFTAQKIVRPEAAISLEPRMALSKNGRIYGFSLKVWPDFAPSIIDPEQRRMIDHYQGR